ncbi:hypothetical protein [Roseomonas sp. 18066]|uniref:hypothetical protein n=1 Tax=Roseomonas sp. 18066 TaxID=2681412 RepID=UPI001356C4B1|nr:hypothetical protein [Roseomonas sp. 18066]
MRRRAGAPALLLLLSAVAQALLLHAYRYELAALARGSTALFPPYALPLLLAPSAVGIAGCLAARALRRRGSAWAGPVLLAAFALLLLGAGAALHVTLHPLDLG